MPTTLTGLLLFIVLLLPGFAYLVGKERNGTERRLSPFRETVAIVAASVTAELAVLTVFAVVRTLWPSATPDIGALIRDSGTYLGGGPGHHGQYAQVAAWGVGLLALASIFAYLATMPRIRGLIVRLTGPYPHDSTVSAWWILFDRWAGSRNIQLVCMLDDGSCVRGQFGSFNISADDSPDRDLILKKPIYYRPPGNPANEALYPVEAMCCSARRIVALFVNYSDPAAEETATSLSTADPQEAVEAAEQTAAVSEALPSAAGQR
jgi:hypothetical protein